MRLEIIIHAHTSKASTVHFYSTGNATTPPLALMWRWRLHFHFLATEQIFCRADAGLSRLNQSHVRQLQTDTTAVHSNPSDPASQESVAVSLAGLMTCWSRDCFVDETLAFRRSHLFSSVRILLRPNSSRSSYCSVMFCLRYGAVFWSQQRRVFARVRHYGESHGHHFMQAVLLCISWT